MAQRRFLVYISAGPCLQIRQPFHDSVFGTRQIRQPLQGRRISRVPKTTYPPVQNFSHQQYPSDFIFFQSIFGSSMSSESHDHIIGAWMSCEVFRCVLSIKSTAPIVHWGEGNQLINLFQHGPSNLGQELLWCDHVITTATQPLTLLHSLLEICWNAGRSWNLQGFWIAVLCIGKNPTQN